MRSLIVALVAASFAVSASSVSHKEHVYTFTEAQFQKMQEVIGETVRRREADAYEAGQEDARERCPSLI